MGLVNPMTEEVEIYACSCYYYTKLGSYKEFIDIIINICMAFNVYFFLFSVTPM